MRANATTGAGWLSARRILFPLCSEGVKSKSYGRARAEPENNGIIFISLPPIKVPHKRKKAPLSSRWEILKTLTNQHPLTTTERVAFRMKPQNPHQSTIATASRTQRETGKELSVQKVFENPTLAKDGCYGSFEVLARQPEMASYLFMLYKVAQAESSLMKIQEPHSLCFSVLL